MRFPDACRTAATAIIAVAAVLTCFSTLAGIVSNYSPVPFWDMWNGYLEFFWRSAEEGWAPWWEQHNEHRLVLAKLIFWIDLQWFDGSMVLLFVLNGLFAGLTWLVFAVWLRKLSPGDSLARTPMFWLVLLFAFSWAQHENFTWAFQSQFWMAYLLPLSAFLMLALAASGDRRFFFGAVILGCVSAFTMANGVLALPLLLLQSVAQRMPWPRSLLILLAAIFIWTVYFYGYQSPEWHPSWSSALSDHPSQVAGYFLSYLGGPVHAVLGGWARWPAMLAGLLVIALCVWLASPLLTGQRLPALQIGLLAFMLFIGGAALSTAMGRAGLDQTYAQFLPSRYLTPALMGWSALGLLLNARFNCWANHRVAVLLLCLALGLSTTQSRIMHEADFLLDRRAAVLAVSMGVKDADFIRRVYFDADRMFPLVQRASEEGLSVGNLPELREGKALIGTPAAADALLAECKGYLDSVTVWPLFNGSENGYRLEGWLFHQDRTRVPELIAIVAKGQVIGLAMTGWPREDVADLFGRQVAGSGFVGWLIGSEYPLEIELHALRPDCRLLLAAGE